MNVQPGETFTVTLRGDAKWEQRGIGWPPEPDPIVARDGWNFQPDAGATGAGTYTFRFTAHRLGEVTLKFEEVRRRYEPPLQTHTVDVVVSPLEMGSIEAF